MQDLVIEWKEDGTHLLRTDLSIYQRRNQKGKPPLSGEASLDVLLSLEVEYLQVSRSMVELAYNQPARRDVGVRHPIKDICRTGGGTVPDGDRAGRRNNAREQAGGFSQMQAAIAFPFRYACASEVALTTFAVPPVLVDFSPNAIDMRNFPFDLWRKVNRNALNLKTTEICFCRRSDGRSSPRPHDFPIFACIPWRDLQTGADRGGAGTIIC